MELAFDVFCGKCLKNLPGRSGIVLSCGDFLCDQCAPMAGSGCPSCGSKDVNVVLLDNPPPEVASVLNNPASELQDIFDTLKFQIRHYKSSLVRARTLLRDSELERRRMAKQIESMSLNPGRGQVAGRMESRDDKPSDPPKMFWKTGSADSIPSNGMPRAPGSGGHGRASTESYGGESAMGRRPSSTDDRMRGSVMSPSRGYNTSGGTRPTTPYTTPAYERDSADNGKRKMIGEYSGRYSCGRQTTENGSKSTRAIYMRTPKSGMSSVPSAPSATSPSSRLRSPYIPYVRTPGKAVRLSQREL